jgi:hypothetical protein
MDVATHLGVTKSNQKAACVHRKLDTLSRNTYLTCYETREGWNAVVVQELTSETMSLRYLNGGRPSNLLSIGGRLQ